MWDWVIFKRVSIVKLRVHCFYVLKLNGSCKFYGLIFLNVPLDQWLCMDRSLQLSPNSRFRTIIYRPIMCRIIECKVYEYNTMTVYKFAAINAVRKQTTVKSLANPCHPCVTVHTRDTRVPRARWVRVPRATPLPAPPEHTPTTAHTLSARGSYCLPGAERRAMGPNDLQVAKDAHLCHYYIRPYKPL